MNLNEFLSILIEKPLKDYEFEITIEGEEPALWEFATRGLFHEYQQGYSVIKAGYHLAVIREENLVSEESLCQALASLGIVRRINEAQQKKSIVQKLKQKLGHLGEYEVNGWELTCRIILRLPRAVRVQTPQPMETNNIPSLRNMAKNKVLSSVDANQLDATSVRTSDDLKRMRNQLKEGGVNQLPLPSSIRQELKEDIKKYPKTKALRDAIGKKK